MVITKYWMFKIGVLLLLITSIDCYNQSIVDYSLDPYTAYENIFGRYAVETPDGCDDKVNHISSDTDAILGRKVFVHTLHCNSSYQDGDRCNGDYSRQRAQVKVYDGSPSWMHGYSGSQFTFAWKIYLDSGFQYSGKFNHIFQLKLIGSGPQVANPNLTITLRSKAKLEGWDNLVLTQVNISKFIGTWIQLKMTVTYGSNGCVNFIATKIADGSTLMSYNGCGLALDNNGTMIRPKFGMYRSLENIIALRTQYIKIVDLCIGEGSTTCNYNSMGVKI